MHTVAITTWGRRIALTKSVTSCEDHVSIDSYRTITLSQYSHTRASMAGSNQPFILVHVRIHKVPPTPCYSNHGAAGWLQPKISHHLGARQRTGSMRRLAARQHTTVTR